MHNVLIKVMCCICLITSLCLPVCGASSQDELIFMQHKAVTVLNESIKGKREVIDYWLKRMDPTYTPNKLNSYIEYTVEEDKIVEYANRLVLQLEQTDLTLEQRVAYLMQNKDSLIMYSVQQPNSTNIKFSLYYDGDYILKKAFPGVSLNVSMDDIRAYSNSFYETTGDIQSSLYSQLDYSNAPSRLMLGNPIPNTITSEIMTSAFGDREDLYFGENNLKNHTGIDLAMPEGTKVVASLGGKVEKVVYTDWGYGRYVVLNHGGYYTLYGHCSELLVTEGQYVQSGEVIAKVGSTGWSTGNHLHFEVIINGHPVNPLLLMTR